MESIQKADWELFRVNGRVPPSIRPAVLQSWMRCRAQEDVAARKWAPRVEGEALDFRRLRSDRLRAAARPAMARAGYALDDSRAMILLCDADGVVLETAGDVSVQQVGADFHLNAGGVWKEDGIGTNAIGAALRCGRPVRISGVEHYCEAVQFWSCAAAPIRDPLAGDILGVIDISAPAGSAMRQAEALAISLAAHCEQILLAQSVELDRKLAHMVMTERLPRRNLIVFDRYGRKAWSGPCSDEFEQETAPRAEAQLRGFLAEDPDLFRGRRGRAVAEDLARRLPQARVELLRCDREEIGLAIALDKSASLRPSRLAMDLEWLAAGSPAMAACVARARDAMAAGAPASLAGKAGAGKKTLARALFHDRFDASARLAELDCALMNSDGLRAAPFDALAERGGMALLIDPAATPAPLQAPLARALDRLTQSAGEYVRLVSIAGEPLAQAFEDGRLRPELFYRLDGAEVRVPGLAERPQEMRRLARHFAEQARGAGRGRAPQFTPAAIKRLEAHDWPGNLHEMKRMIERLTRQTLAPVLDVGDLRLAAAGGPNAHPLREAERAEILDALARAGGNLTQTARLLNIARSTLYLKLDAYGVPRNGAPRA